MDETDFARASVEASKAFERLKPTSLRAAAWLQLADAIGNAASQGWLTMDITDLVFRICREEEERVFGK